MTRCCLFFDLRPRGSCRGKKQYVCAVCGAVHTQGTTRRRKSTPTTTATNGRKLIYLGLQHPYANSGGWQYLYRYVVMCALNRQLRTDEHVDHIDGDIRNNSLCNLRVIVARDHALRHLGHESFDVIAQHVDGLGFVELHDASTVTPSRNDQVPF